MLDIIEIFEKMITLLFKHPSEFAVMFLIFSLVLLLLVSILVRKQKASARKLAESYILILDSEKIALEMLREEGRKISKHQLRLLASEKSGYSMSVYKSQVYKRYLD